MKKKTSKKEVVVDEFTENPEDLKIVAKEDPAEEQEDIFSRGLSGWDWKGKELFPFCKQRRMAAMGMGLRFGTLPAEDSAEFDQSGYYRGMESDVSIMLWILTVPKLQALRAIRYPEAALQKAIDFGEEEGLEPGTDEYQRAAMIMLQAFVDLAKVKGIYKSPHGKDTGEKPLGN